MCDQKKKIDQGQGVRDRGINVYPTQKSKTCIMQNQGSHASHNHAK